MKKLLIAVGLIIVLVIVALFAIPMFIDPNDHKDTIVEQVKKHTGRDLKIAGDLKMSRFPSLGVDIGEIEMSNALGFGDKPMLKSGRASVSVKLLPILKSLPGFITDKEKAMASIADNVEISTLVLKDVYINLARDKSGKSNFDDLMKSDGTESTAEESETGSTTDLSNLSIGGIDLQNVNLVWDDQSLGKKYTLSQLNLKTGTLQLNQPIDIDMSCMVDAAAEGLAGNISLDGIVEYDLEGKKYSLKPLNFIANLKGSAIPGGTADIKLKATSVLADLTAGTVNIAGLDLDAMGTKISGDIDATNIFDKIPLANGNLVIDAQSIPDLLKALGQDPDKVPLTKLTANAVFKSGKDSMTFEKLVADATLQGGMFKQTENVNLDIKGNVNIADQTLNLSSLSIKGLGASVDGNINASNIMSSIPLLNGQLNINATDVPALMAALGQDASAMPLKSLTANTKLTSTADTMKVENLTAKAVLAGDQIPNSPVDVTLNTTADLNLKTETLNVQSFTIKGMGLDVQGALNGTQIVKNPNFNGNLKIAQFNLRQMMEQMKIEVPVTSDPKVLSTFGLNTNISATKDSVSLKGFAIKLDDTNITGDLSVVNFENPAPTFNINIDAINADRYMAPKAEGEPVAEASSEATGEVPMESLRKLKAKGSLNIGSLIISNAKLKNVKFGLDAKGGKIKLNPLSANLYKGSYNGAVNLDATGSQPAVNVSSALNGVQVAPLLTDLTGDSKIDGTLIGDIKINAVGADANAIKKTLNGTTDLKFTNGALLGVNIAKIIREGKAKLTGQTLPPGDEPVKTDFSELSASTSIKNGLVTNPDFLMKSPFIRVTGKGTANLVSEVIDYSVVATIVGSGKGQGGKDLADLQGIDIPVKVSGTFSNMKYRPDLGGVAKAKLDKELDKQKEKLQEKATEKLEKILPGKLKGLGGLLGGGDKATEGTAEEQAAPTEAKKPEEQVKNKLKGLLKF